ncbi:bestrophin family ion channel [Nibrella saemangeumensis]|uniref:Bestrophin family ion channel n=1 Tax=Nibrella saemangeumensis TaxID=1084526 RepID=A0ABP8MH97_9BACT
MIIYESNRNWLRDVNHLYRSYTMQKIVRSTLWVGAGMTLINFLVHGVFKLTLWRIETGTFSLLGIVLSILLVFRTNSAYDRWWEGRRQWGNLVNNCRTLAMLLHASLPESDLESRRFMAAHIANFCIALKEHLRGGVKLTELIHVTAEERDLYGTKTHLPNFIAAQIQVNVQEKVRAGELTAADLLNIKPHTQTLYDVAGACERIKKTPIPFSYNVYLKLYISAYTLILPFGLLPNFGYVGVGLIMFIFFAFIGIELMAEEIEEPFGLDCNDLPIGDITHTIKQNVYELLEVGHPEEPKPKELYQKVF